MTSESEKQKLLEDFKEGVEVLCEVEKVADPKENPFKKGKVVKVIFPAEKAKTKDVFIEVNTGNKNEKFLRPLVSRICQSDEINVPDMAEVSPINTKDLLTNIQNRYKKDKIFTNVGDTLIITNPYYIIPGLYTEEKMQEIIKSSFSNSKDRYERSEPHCFDTTMNTIFDLLNSGKNQALVISGESGAGKTECAKLCMKFIVYYFRKSTVGACEFSSHRPSTYNIARKSRAGIIPPNLSDKIPSESTENEQKGSNSVSLEDKILACNPVLEAFGNAKTVRNDNSSRFGKYVKIYINTQKEEIIGAYMETYLLEKSRVVMLAPGERNYHIFYQVVIGLNSLIKDDFSFEKIFASLKEQKLELGEETKKYVRENLTREFISSLFFSEGKLEQVSMEKFTYLKNDVYSIPSINDALNFFECVEGMVNAGFKSEEVNLVLELVMAVLWCGNIDFEPDGEGSKVSAEGKKVQEKVCKMLKMDMEIFKDAFLFNVRIIKGETIKTPMAVKDCVSFRDTFAKEIYNRLFGYLVKRMNKTLFNESLRDEIETNEDVRHIGLLDIFGFECFKENSFEQFCINYANEKLQNLYVEDIFKEIELMFEREGLKDHFKSIEYKDNILILDAMGKYPSGIFFQLDNECNVGQKDMNLLGRILSTLKNNPSIKSSLKNKDKFFISHTAKDVEYGINGFCVKNLDEFKLRMKDSILSIKDKVINEMIGEGQGEERHKKEKYLGGKFRSDMDNLAKALRMCVRHYIRCLKPNELKKKNYFVPWFSLLQIKYMGVLDTIKIRQEGFPVIKSYYEFYMRYEDAVDFPGKLPFKAVTKEEEKLKEWDQLIAKTLVPSFSTDDCLFGKTLVLMRQRSADAFDAARRKALLEKEKNATIINNAIRGVLSKKEYTTFYNGICTLQQNHKLYEYINKMNKAREIVRVIQARSRVINVKKKSEEFKKKLQNIKNFIQTSHLQIERKKTRAKYLSMKFCLINYIKIFREKKAEKYKSTVKALLEKIMTKYIKSSFEPNVIYIQKNIRGYLAKLNLGEIYTMITDRRKVLKQDIACKKIQTNFRRFLAYDNVRKYRTAKDKFIGLIQYHRFQLWYVKARKAALKIQAAFMRKYLKRKIIEQRLKEFTEEEDDKFEEATVVSNNNLFPSKKTEDTTVNSLSPSTDPASQVSPENVPKNAPRGSVTEIKEAKKQQKLQEFYDKKVNNNVNPMNNPEAQFLNHSAYDVPKLYFFAHILDFDPIINLDDIYSLPWTETYQEVVEHNINQNTPIQLIEIGDYHTTLVNTNGKTFTWGWNGNGQCAFNVGKDIEFLFDNVKPSKNIYEDGKGNKNRNNINSGKVNGNLVKNEGEIGDFEGELEGLLGDDFDFEAEIDNIKKEKEVFSQEENIDGFNKDSFDEFYYVDAPMIIDNFNVKKIACGSDNTMVLTKDDKLYIFGANYDYQLGVLKNRNIFSPMFLNNVVKNQQTTPLVNVKSKITEMKFSGKNALLLNEDGNLIMLSCFSEVNSSYPELFRTPLEIPIPEAKFRSLECGKDFAFMLSENGVLFSMGKNEFGQLGLGDTKDRNFPTKVQYFVEHRLKVQQISCGFKHCAAKAGGKAYTWGCNKCGQLGTRNLKEESSPKLIDIKYTKLDNNIMQVSCGFRSTVFMTETRRLFWCGTCGDIKKETVPIEFNYENKVPELFSYNNHEIMKISHTWSKTVSILYATVAETGPLRYKLNNPSKLNYILNSISSKWTNKNLYPPIIDQMENYVAEKHIVRQVKKVKGKK